MWLGWHRDGKRAEWQALVEADTLDAAGDRSANHGGRMRLTPAQKLDALALPPITEAAFQRQVLTYATLTGWLGYHTYDSRRSKEGFLDWVFVRERVVFVELKAEKGRLSKAQERWIEALKAADAEVYVWKPADWAQIEKVLGR